MAGHVPKFGAQNAGNFTEVFALARTGGKAGSGDSRAAQEEHPPLRNPRAPAPGGRGGAPAGVASRRGPGSGPGGSGSFEKDVPEPRRGSGAHEREGSNRSQEGGNMLGSNRPSSATRAEQRENSGRGGRGEGQGTSRGVRKPRNINEEYAGASHLPKFGDWNTGEAGEANYTVMFSAASKERQTGSAGDLGSKSTGKGSGDLYNRSSNVLTKKHSPSWWCFS